MARIAAYIDHTALKADTTEEMIDQLVEEAKHYHFASVCVNPTWVYHVAQALKGTDVKVCTVVGFPLGANTSQIKAIETRDAVANGADEIDMVINIAWAKMHAYDKLESDILAVVNAAEGKIVKVILETCLLSDEEIDEACKAAARAGADFVKTSTGFSKSGASVKAVKRMKAAIPSRMKVKAAGGIHTLDEALCMIEAGAERIGASAGVQIVKEEAEKKVCM